jgi:hypothetical protein
MYVSPNFKSKAELKRALAAGRTVRVYSPGPFPCPQNGRVTIEGPHYPEPHKWYGTAEVKEGVVTSVK